MVKVVVEEEIKSVDVNTKNSPLQVIYKMSLAVSKKTSTITTSINNRTYLQ